MQFVPLWDSILDNLKLHKLGPELLGKWMLFLVAAQRHDCYEGTLPDLETLAFWLRLSTDELKRWIRELAASKMIDQTEDGWRIHDWNDWRCVKDKTSRERVRRHRQKDKKPATEQPCNGDVTPPVTATKRACNGVEASNDQRSFASAHSQTPAETRAAGVCEAEEPFDPGPVTLPISPAFPPDKQRVLDRQIQRWGASNGDRVIGDLLNDYAAVIVSAACDYHYTDNDGKLDPRRLRGVCREMHAGRWKLKPNESIASRDRPPPPIYGAIQGP